MKRFLSGRQLFFLSAAVFFLTAGSAKNNKEPVKDEGGARWLSAYLPASSSDTQIQYYHYGKKTMPMIYRISFDGKVSRLAAVGDSLIAIDAFNLPGADLQELNNLFKKAGFLNYDSVFPKIEKAEALAFGVIISYRPQPGMDFKTVKVELTGNGTDYPPELVDLYRKLFKSTKNADAASNKSVR